MKKIKFIKRQDSGFKLSYGNSGETSLNLSNEIFDFISQGTLSPGDERDITFRIYKEDYIKAMSFVIMKLPLYKSSSNYSNKVENYLDIFNELYSKIEEYFGSKKEAEYTVSLLYRSDGRIYLKGLRVNGFSIRDYLVENCSAIQFDNEGVNLFNLRVLSDIEDNGELEDEKTIEFEDKLSLPLQQIFYGAPGTGKSHEIKEQTKGQSVIRTTFHPDSDYSTFVGAYKPFMDSVSARVVPVVINNGISLNQNVGTYNEKRITYKFVKQAFLKAYLGAWKKYSEGKNCPVSIKVKGKIEFDTNSGHYILLSVSDNNILYSREFDFDKATVEKVWSTLWNNDLFSIPTGPQSGQSVEQAIASWIKNNYESCTKADFENGWNFLIQKINEDSSIVVKKDNGDGNSTREYILKSHHENTKVRVKVREAGKSKDAIEKCFSDDNKRENQLEAKIVELLKKYEGNFEEKWNQLKSDVNDGSEVREKLTYRTQYLIIEEINRGNCAQIFGDLFQLLDRSANGFSEYPIEADTDMQDAIKNAFAEEDEYKVDSLNIDDVIDGYISNYDSTLSNDVREGRVLLLPPNLYIWATMNTSDQSLFPIDSAFKRRWDWIYRPIGYKNSHWTIEIGEKRYNWVDFQKRINQKIYDVDNSEDKQLGDYFVNADRTGDTINADTLLNKILFYLWNDVCKDDPDQIFRWIDDKKQTESIKFSDFFGADREKKLQGFMTFNEIKAIGEPQNADTNMIQQDEEEAVTSDTPTEEDKVLNE